MSNNNITTQSIFDSIRRFDEQGNEYWMARELMKALGYKQWRRFAFVIEVAQENLETAVENPENHIARRDNVVKRAQRLKLVKYVAIVKA